MINLGLEYEDIEAIALEVCEIVMAADNYRGDIICPGVVPSYGPHVSKPGVTCSDLDFLSNLLNLIFCQSHYSSICMLLSYTLFAAFHYFR